MNEWTEPSRIDGSRSRADLESTQEYHDSEFRNELGVSDPAHSLFPACLLVNDVAGH